MNAAKQPPETKSPDAIGHAIAESDSATSATTAVSEHQDAGSTYGGTNSDPGTLPGSNDRSEAHRPADTPPETCGPPASTDDVDQQIAQHLSPSDPIEALWVRDICSLVAEADRLRGWRIQIVEQARAAAVQQLIRPILDVAHRDPEGGRETGSAATLALSWAGGQTASCERVDRLLGERGLTRHSVAAKAFQLALSDVERIDRMIAAADHRRDTLLAALARRRTAP